MKLDRLLGILITLLRRGQVGAPFLAEKFEVSRRTIGRDIDALCRAGIPIVTRQGAGGGISLAEGFRLEKGVLTKDELLSVVVALKGLGSVSETSQIQRMLEKFAAGGDAVFSLKESVVIDLASHYKGSLTGKIERFKRAIRESRLTDFTYYNEKGESRRRIEPYLILFKWTSWYVFGYCTARRDWRLFKLARLWDLSLREDVFAPREIPPERRDLDARLTDHLTVTALFDPSAKYQLIEAYGPGCFSQDADGSLRARIGYTDRAYIISWLLSFGDKVSVLAPGEIIGEIRRIAENILKNHS